MGRHHHRKPQLIPTCRLPGTAPHPPKKIPGKRQHQLQKHRSSGNHNQEPEQIPQNIQQFKQHKSKTSNSLAVAPPPAHYSLLQGHHPQGSPGKPHREIHPANRPVPGVIQQAVGAISLARSPNLNFISSQLFLNLLYSNLHAPRTLRNPAGKPKCINLCHPSKSLMGQRKSRQIHTLPTPETATNRRIPARNPKPEAVAVSSKIAIRRAHLALTGILSLVSGGYQSGRSTQASTMPAQFLLPCIIGCTRLPAAGIVRTVSSSISGHVHHAKNWNLSRLGI